MDNRSKIAATIESLVAARARNDNEAVQRHFAPGAQYRMAANHQLLAGLSVEAGDAERVVADLVSTFRFHDMRTLDLVVDGNKAATRWRVSVSVEGGERIETDLGSFWTFDDNGLITEVHEFADTAQIKAMFPPTP